MSKVQDYTGSGYLKPDPNDATRSIFTIEMSIDNMLIEGDGAIGAFEMAAIGKGWDGISPAPAFLIEWTKRDAAQTTLMVAKSRASQDIEAQIDAAIGARL